MRMDRSITTKFSQNNGSNSNRKLNSDRWNMDRSFQQHYKNELFKDLRGEVNDLLKCIKK